MQVADNIPVSFGGADAQRKWLVRNGLEIWDIICSQFSRGGTFRTSQAVKAVVVFYHCSHKSASMYVSAVLNNVLATQDVDNPCLSKVRSGLWCLLPVEYT